MASVTAMAGETIDALVWRALGSVAGAVEATLELNPALVGNVILPEGASVILPASAQTVGAGQSRAPQTLPTIKLWD